MVSKFIRNTKKMKGQAMAEFALTIPVFLLLVFGIIELSRFFLVYSSVFTAVREATRYGSSVGDGEIPNYQNCEMITETAVRMGNFGGVQTDDVTVYFESQPGTWVADCNPDDDPEDRYQPVLGDRVVVEIDTDYDSVLGIVPDLNVNAENGRTIMLGVQSQVVVVTTEDPEGSSTPEPTEDTTTPEPTEVTTTPEPTEDTSTPEPTEDTYTPEPTEDPTEEIICPTGNIIVNGSPSINNGQQTVTFKIKNNTGKEYKVDFFDAIKWNLTGLKLTSVKFSDVELMQSVSYSSPTGKIYPDAEDDTSFSGPNDITVVFKFSDKTKDIVINSFNIRFSEIDETCPKILNYSGN